MPAWFGRGYWHAQDYLPKTDLGLSPYAMEMLSPGTLAEIEAKQASRTPADMQAERRRIDEACAKGKRKREEEKG